MIEDRPNLFVLGLGFAGLAALTTISVINTIQIRKSVESLVSKLEETNIHSSLIDKTEGVGESQFSEPVGNNWFRTKVRRRFLTG